MRLRSLLEPEYALSLLIALGSIGLVVILNFTPELNNDFWLQLKVGQSIVQTGKIPATLEYPFTEAKDFRFLAHEWLPSTFSAVLFSKVGFDGITLFKAISAVALWFCLVALAYSVCRKKSLSAFLATAALITLNFRMFWRPETPSFFLLAAHLGFLIQFFKTRRKIWLIGTLPVAVLWANTHGSFVVQLGIPPLLALGFFLQSYFDRKKDLAPFPTEDVRSLYLPLFLCTLTLFLATLLNPLGFELHRRIFDFSHANYLQFFIHEWRPTLSAAFRQTAPFTVFIGFSLLVVGVGILSKISGAIWTLPLVTVFGVLALRANRHIAHFAIVALLFLAASLKSQNWSLRAERWAQGVLAGTLALAIFWVVRTGNVIGMRPGFQHSDQLSQGAVEFIQKHGIKGNILNSIELGAGLAYHFYPRIKITIDSRVDSYGEKYWRNYYDLMSRPQPLQSFIEKYDVHTIIVSMEDVNFFLARNFHPLLEWYFVYHDEQTAILSRENLCGPGDDCPQLKRTLRRLASRN